MTRTIIVIFLLLSPLLLTATHAKAGECMTLRDVRAQSDGYPRYHRHGKMRCWYVAGRRHKATSPRKVEVEMVGETKPVAIEVELTRDEPAFAFSDQYDPGNMVRAMVPKERKVTFNASADSGGDGRSSRPDETRLLSAMTTSAGADDPATRCDADWVDGCDLKYQHPYLEDEHRAAKWIAGSAAVASVLIALGIGGWRLRRDYKGITAIGEFGS